MLQDLVGDAYTMTCLRTQPKTFGHRLSCSSSNTKIFSMEFYRYEPELLNLKQDHAVVYQSSHDGKKDGHESS